MTKKRELNLFASSSDVVTKKYICSIRERRLGEEDEGSTIKKESN